MASRGIYSMLLAGALLAGGGALALNWLKSDTAAEDAPKANRQMARSVVDSELTRKLMEKTKPKRVMLGEGDAARGAEQGLLPPGVKSILNVDSMMRFGDYEWDTASVPAASADGALLIRVDVGRQLISVFKGGHEIGAAVILYGMDGKETPLGRFPILGKDEDYRSRTYDAPMPYSLWMTNDGVALHATSVTEGRATNGCVGVPLGFARQIFAIAQKGDIIEVIRTEAAEIS